jgi:TetR/AcrR family transcriptional repressor of nem operon
VARPREFDEKKVLRAAREQFWSVGYAGTTMDAIAAATGLGKGSLYGAFGDKHQLFLRVFDAYCTDIVNAVGRDLDGPDDQALERLRAHIRAVAARARRTFDLLGEALVADIQAAQRHGDIDPAADPHELADLVLAVLRGIEALGKAGKNQATLQAIAETAIAVLPGPTGAAPPARKGRRRHG